MQASQLEEPEGVLLGPTDVVAVTLEVVGTKVMGAAGTTADLEDTAMAMEGPETTVAETRVVMTATQEAITETITTTEEAHAPKM